MASKKTTRFLIVDDSDANLLFFEMLLKGLDYLNVQTAHAGAEGLALVEAGGVDFVVVAWELASMAGTVFVQKARSARKRRHMPFVIYSKRMGAEDVKLLQELGIENLLPMPFDRQKAADFVAAIVQAWERPDPVLKAVRDIDDCIDNNAFNDALRHLTARTLAPGPHAHLVQTAHGEIWMRLSRYDKAEAALAEALRLKPEHVPALRLLAKIKSAKGQHQEALALLEQLSQASPKNITTMLCLGSAYVKADKHDAARKVLAKVGDLDPESRPARDEVGTMAFKEGNMALAAQLLSETDSGDEIAAYFNNLGIAYVARNEVKRGIDTYTNAMRVLATKAKLYVLHYNLGLAQRKDGDLAGALRSFTEAYVMEPAFEKAYAAFVKLYKQMKETATEVALLKSTATLIKATRTAHAAALALAAAATAAEGAAKAGKATAAEGAAKAGKATAGAGKKARGTTAA